jgi:hypothetical protein
MAGSIVPAGITYLRVKTMKKNRALVILFLFFNCFLSSETFNVKDGTYAFYIDLRSKEIVYRGFLSYRLNSDDYILFVRDIYLEQNNFEFSYFRILPGNEKGIDLKDSIPDPIFSDVVDFVDFNKILKQTKNMTEIEKTIIYSQKEYSETGNRVYDDNSYEITLNQYLPFFKISSMRRQGDCRNLFILDKYGNIFSDELHEFYLIKPDLEQNKVYQSQSREKKEEILHDVRIMLDSNWQPFDETRYDIATLNEEAITIAEGPVRKIRTDGYGASIYVEKDKKEEIGEIWDNIEQYIIRTEMTDYAYKQKHFTIDYSTFKVFIENEKTIIQYKYKYDEDYRSYIKYIIVIKTDEALYKIVFYTSLNNFYENGQYYSDIIQSIRLEK